MVEIKNIIVVLILSGSTQIAWGQIVVCWWFESRDKEIYNKNQSHRESPQTLQLTGQNALHRY